MNVHIPRRVCADVRAALEREWIVTNGLGGYASGTVAGALTRRYHGLLMAALKPPVGRTLLVAKLDEVATVEGQPYPLYTNIWSSGIEQPNACDYLRRFDLHLGVPTWTFELGRALLVKRIWMEQGRNTTWVQYELDPSAPPVELECRLLVNDRFCHHLTSTGAEIFQVQATETDIEVRPPHTADIIAAWCTTGAGGRRRWEVSYDWCRGFHLPVEASRGQDHQEDHLCIGSCRPMLNPGETFTFRVGLGREEAGDPRAAVERRLEHARARLDEWRKHTGVEPERTPLAVRQLVLAADQFIAARPSPEEPDGLTVIAGYPWFTDWGRDTMIALPGLALVTGRLEVARRILLSWARHVDRGMIPNEFPDDGAQPQYHTADATLWYLWAIDQYVRASGDVQTLAALFPVMKEIVHWHRLGTRHNIRVGDDGLVYAGEPGVNLTWMDAKVGDHVVTPRIGKAIELSALWYDALANMARLADLLNESGDEYARLADVTADSFQRFFNPDTACCYDVLDGPDGDCPEVRPNQIFAVSLTHSALERRQQAAVVATCGETLATWFGLRSLAPQDSKYHGTYTGGRFERDESYHQGTVWGWLLGPYVIARYRIDHDAPAARQVLEPLYGQLWAAGVGSLSEIFDGDPPHRPNGCFAQAWSVSEVLRAWWVTQQGKRAIR